MIRREFEEAGGDISELSPLPTAQQAAAPSAAAEEPHAVDAEAHDDGNVESGRAKAGAGGKRAGEGADAPHGKRTRSSMAATASYSPSGSEPGIVEESTTDDTAGLEDAAQAADGQGPKPCSPRVGVRIRRNISVTAAEALGSL